MIYKHKYVFIRNYYYNPESYKTLYVMLKTNKMLLSLTRYEHICRQKNAAKCTIYLVIIHENYIYELSNNVLCVNEKETFKCL